MFPTFLGILERYVRSVKDLYEENDFYQVKSLAVSWKSSTFAARIDARRKYFLRFSPKCLVDSIKLPTFASEIIDVLECTSYIYINGGYNRAGFQHVIRV